MAPREPEHIPTFSSVTLYTQGTVGFVLVSVFFFFFNTVMTWGLSMPYQQQPGCSWDPDLVWNFLLGTLGGVCNLLTLGPVLRDTGELHLKGQLCRPSLLTPGP